MEKTYITGKAIPTTTDPVEVYNLYLQSLNCDELSDEKFLFAWNYNRLEDSKKDLVCKMINNKE